MKGKEILRPILSTVGVVLTLLCTTIFFYKVTTLNQEQYKRYELDYGWNVRINDDVYENVDLNQFIFPKMVKRGDVVCLTNTLPKGIPTDSTIRILNYLTGVEVSVGGNSQYLYGMDLFREHKFIGSGYHFVHLDKNSGGKDIRITFYPAEDGAFSSISSIVVTDSDYIYADFFNRNVLAIFCAVFLFILGNILMVVGFFVQSKDVVYHRLIPIGAFSYLIGLWSLCDSKFMELYSLNFEFNSILEYVTLYAALIPIMCLIIEIRRETLLKEKWKYRVMAGLTGVNLLFLLVTSILHFTNVVHYSAFVSVFHGIAILCVITILLLGAKPIRDMEKDEKVLNIALLEILLFGIVDMVRFNLQVYVFPQVDILNVSILPLGTLIFIIILLVSYLVFIYSRVLDEATRQTLTMMAFQDSMTGLYNRAKSEALFETFNTDENQDCTMILFDVNKLKVTNDTFGHNQGDALLKIFATSLSQAFDQEGANVIRMGGDEFLVFWDRIKDQKHIERCLLRLDDLNREASQTQPFLVEASYGVAFSDELREHDAESIYKLADFRMYEMKKVSHNDRGK